MRKVYLWKTYLTFLTSRDAAFEIRHYSAPLSAGKERS
jgi:hypothetical protein